MFTLPNALFSIFMWINVTVAKISYKEICYININISHSLQICLMAHEKKLSTSGNTHKIEVQISATADILCLCQINSPS
jgi:hypothetical protein